MRRADFEAMIRGMAADVPAGFLDGISAIDVTGKTVPHPVREGIYTLGECIPHVTGGPDDEGPTIQSRVELHYGSFAALARLGDFDWRQEAWETLTHELRHHLEWRARVPALEALDEAAEANYARIDGEPFDPLFYLAGEPIAPHLTRVEDDVFVDVELDGAAWRAAAGRLWSFSWHGRPWVAPLPTVLPDILLLNVLGVEPAPAGDLVIVIRRRAGWRALFARRTVAQETVSARAGTATAR